MQSKTESLYKNVIFNSKLREVFIDKHREGVNYLMERALSQIESTECPALNRGGYLYYTLDTTQNWRVYVTDRQEILGFLGNSENDNYPKSEYKFIRRWFQNKKELLAYIWEYYSIKVMPTPPETTTELALILRDDGIEELAKFDKENNIINCKNICSMVCEVINESDFPHSAVVFGIICEKKGSDDCVFYSHGKCGLY